jgi:hypothetical protein
MRDRVAHPRPARRRSPRRAFRSHHRCSWFDAPKKSLGRIGKIVVFGQPAALDAIETIDSFNCPMTACFPCLGGMQHSELTICRSVQGSDPSSGQPAMDFAALLIGPRETDPHLLNYGNSTSTRDKPMSCNSASGTDQISLWWIKRLKKWMKVIMANRSLSAMSKRDCVRMTAERSVHLTFRIALSRSHDSRSGTKDSPPPGGSGSLPFPLSASARGQQVGGTADTIARLRAE